MNAICNPDLDRSASSFTHSQQSALNTMIHNLNLLMCGSPKTRAVEITLVSLHIISHSQGLIIFCCHMVLRIV